MKYVITIDVDETNGTFNDCEGCVELVFNDTPNTRDEKPIKVLKIERVKEDEHKTD